MNIRLHPETRERGETVAAFVERQLDTHLHRDGALEICCADTDSTRAAFGRLVELLADRGLLIPTDVTQITHGYPVNASFYS